jgi:very-short-patch-repair endonuclease
VTNALTNLKNKCAVLQERKNHGANIAIVTNYVMMWIVSSVLINQYWSKTNKISPRDITHGIRRKHDFDCPDCGRWFQILIANITCLGQWCGACKHKTEAKLLKWLNTVIKAAIIHGAKFEWCKNKKFLPLDFCIEQFKLIIELDGIQHFKLVKLYRNSPAENLKNDMYKLRCAIKNGYTVIRLLQEDVWNDRNNWQARLLPYLRKHNTQKIILIDNKNEYDPMRREIKRTMKRIPVTNDKLPKVPRKLLKESSSSDSDSSSDDESKTKITNKKQSRSHSSNT